MKRASSILLLALAAGMITTDSIAEGDAGTGADAGTGTDAGSDAGAPRIPPRVDASAIPSFASEPFPSEPTPAPKASEWMSAPRVRLTRVAPGTRNCQGFRVREWVKIHCDRRTAGIRLLAGSVTGVELWVPEPDGPDALSFPLATLGKWGEIVFPVRPGDRRIFETIDLDFGEWEGWGTTSGVIVEEQWAEGAEKPEIALLMP